MDCLHGYVTSCFYDHQLYCLHWKPTCVPKAVVFLAHGLGEHVSRYTEIALRLQKEDYMVISHDHVGHGKSSGSRIFIDKIESYAKDVFAHFEKIKNEIPEDCPKFIIGHSMGGTIAIKCGLMRPDFFAGIVLISPGLAPNPDDAGFIKVTLGKMLKHVAPNFPVHYIDPKNISSDPERVRQFVEDELCYHGWVKCVWAVAMLEMTQEIKSSLADIAWPFFLLQGEKDKITLPDFAKEFFEKTSSQDKTLKLFNIACHNLLHEVDEVRTSTLDEILFWVKQRVPAPRVN